MTAANGAGAHRAPDPLDVPPARWLAILVRTLLGVMLAAAGWYLSLIGLVFILFENDTWCEGAATCANLRPWAAVPGAGATVAFALCLWLWTPVPRRPGRGVYLVAGIVTTALVTWLIYLT